MFIEVTSHKTDKVHAINVNKIMSFSVSQTHESRTAIYFHRDFSGTGEGNSLTVNESFDEVKRLIQEAAKSR